jgi:mannose/cellobiose epimerase-like protein (N-acyl-D-glucosamine 2-epimerase family)
LQENEHREWAREHFIKLLGHWMEFAPTESGFFRTDANERWERRGEAPATLVTQTRLIFTFSKGMEFLQALNGSTELSEKLKSALSKSIPFLLERFRDTEYGGWFFSVDDKGHVVSEEKDLYGHAFVILALATAASNPELCSFHSDLSAAARATIRFVMESFRDSESGFIRYKSRDMSEDLDDKRTQNSIMHLFEALSAAIMPEGFSDGTKQAAEEAANEVLAFVLDRLYDVRHHCLPEFYDEHWKQLPPSEGGEIDIGHQFEWSFLLRATPLAKGPDSRKITRVRDALLNFAVKNGIAAANGAVRSDLNSPPDDPIVWWTQCEAIRAALLAGKKYAGQTEQLVKFYRSFFVDDKYGGCYASVTPQGVPVNTDKGSLWKAGYHETGMLLALAGGGNR